VQSLRVEGDRIAALAVDVGEVDAESVLLCVGPATQVVSVMRRSGLAGEGECLT
jgi:hypothetical protein